MSRSLEEMRQEIENINLELLRLLSRRGRLVQEIFAWKADQGSAHHDPHRVTQMLGQIVKHNPGPFAEEVIQHLFSEVFSASLTLIDQPANE